MRSHRRRSLGRELGLLNRFSLIVVELLSGWLEYGGRFGGRLRTDDGASRVAHRLDVNSWLGALASHVPRIRRGRREGRHHDTAGPALLALTALREALLGQILPGLDEFLSLMALANRV